MVFEIEDVECFWENDKSIGVRGGIFDDTQFIPKSQIHDDSEVYKKHMSGKLIINEWFAEKKGWV